LRLPPRPKLVVATAELAKEHERNHASRYADGHLPNALPPARPQLRLVQAGQ
jgi:hypothetical protein